MTPPREAERGMILIMVLWSVSLMAIIVVALSAYAQRNLISAGIEMDRVRSEMALRSGVDLAAGLLLARPARARAFLDGDVESASLGGGGVVEIGLRDAAGLIDISRMDGGFLQRAIERVTDSPAAAAELTAAILERRKLVLGEPSETQPATDSHDQAALPAVFTSISELYGLKVPDRGVMPLVMQAAGLYSRGGRINPMAAPDAVLRAIPEITPRDLAALQSAKLRQDMTSPEVQDVFARYEKYIASGESTIFIVEVRIVSGEGLIAGSRLKATIILDSSNVTPFQVLAWSW